jgi:glycosidase
MSWTGAVVLLLASSAWAEGPVPALSIDRIEPPSWWSTSTEQTITLLVEGNGLERATFKTDRAGVSIGRITSPGDGASLFVDVSLAAGVAPGPVKLEVAASDQRLDCLWTIVPKPDHTPAPLGSDDVVYLIMPDRFANGDPSNDSAGDLEPMLDRRNPHAYHGGDFAGLKARLPYLAELGVTTLWITPVYRPAPRWYHARIDRGPRKYADFHGYSPIHFYDTNPHFGSRAEYRALVDAAHRLGLKVLQDQILGYTGPQHHWVAKPPAPGWLHGPIDRPLPCTFRFDALVNPYAPEALRRGVTDGWFFGILPDLNMRDDRVARYAIQQSLWWMTQFAADGVRLDTYPMVDRSFWRDWSHARHTQVPGLNAVGEAWITDAADLSFFQGGRVGWDLIDSGVESVFDFPLNLALTEVVTNKAPVAKLGRALSRDFLYPRPSRLVTFLDNHDTPRLASVPGVSSARYRLAAAFLLTTRGIPQLSWGNEIGLPGHGDDRRAIPGGWPGDARDAFTRAGRTPEEQATFQVFQVLLRLRREVPALRHGRTIELAATDTTLVFAREHESQRMLVGLNFGPGPVELTFASEPLGAVTRFERLFGEGIAAVSADTITLKLPPEQAAILHAR